MAGAGCPGDQGTVSGQRSRRWGRCGAAARLDPGLARAPRALAAPAGAATLTSRRARRLALRGEAGTAPAGTTTVNVQCVLRSDGSFEFRYGTVVAGLGAGGAVTGWSRGGQSGELPDPGSRDVSSALPFTTNGPDNFALEHRGSIPRLGTALQLIVDRVETVAPLAFLLLGDTVNASGISLDLAGAPGCFVFTNVLVTVSVPVVGSTGNGVFSLAIPNLPTLIGSTLASQYVGLTLRNPLNVSTSNALGFTIGI